MLVGIVATLAVLALSVFLFSLSGIPPTAGFFGKYYLFRGAVEHGFTSLVVIAVLNSAVSVYYYLRVTVLMYFRESDREITGLRFSFASVVALALAVIGTFYMGIFPANVLSLAQRSIAGLM